MPAGVSHGIGHWKNQSGYPGIWKGEQSKWKMFCISLLWIIEYHFIGFIAWNNSHLLHWRRLCVCNLQSFLIIFRYYSYLDALLVYSIVDNLICFWKNLAFGRLILLHWIPAQNHFLFIQIRMFIYIKKNPQKLFYHIISLGNSIR